MITETEIEDITDAVTNEVDKWVRAGAGTYDDLSAIVEKAVRLIAQRDDGE